MISTRTMNKERRRKLEEDIDRMTREGYVLYKEKYLISMDNDVPYRLGKDGSSHYTIMKPMSINLTGSTVKGVEYLYKSVGFNSTSRYYLHRLIGEAFKGPIPKGMTIDHIDGNKKNNNLHNLQLLTQGQNSRKSMLKTRAENKIKLEKRIICNENGMEFDSITEAAKGLGGDVKSNATSISKHINKSLTKGYLTKTIKGFTFTYIGKSTNDLKGA